MPCGVSRQAGHASKGALVYTVSVLDARTEILDEKVTSEILREGHYEQVKS